MMRTVVSMVKRVQRNGKTYEFGQDIEPAFTSFNGTHWPELRTTWARVHNGFTWINLHYIITEH
jgi:hypothetical protein